MIFADFTIDKESGVPIWVQLYQRFTYLISSGFYKSGDQLPTVRELATEIDVNYHTINKVYHELEQNGFIKMMVGKGSFVTDLNPIRQNTDSSAIEPVVKAFLEELVEQGMSPENIVRTIASHLGISIVILNPKDTNSKRSTHDPKSGGFRNAG